MCCWRVRGEKGEVWGGEGRGREERGRREGGQERRYEKTVQDDTTKIQRNILHMHTHKDVGEVRKPNLRTMGWMLETRETKCLASYTKHCLPFFEIIQKQKIQHPMATTQDQHSHTVYTYSDSCLTTVQIAQPQSQGTCEESCPYSQYRALR